MTITTAGALATLDLFRFGFFHGGHAGAGTLLIWLLLLGALIWALVANGKIANQ